VSDGGILARPRAEQQETRRLPSIAFTAHLRSVGPERPADCDGATLAEMLDAMSGDYPRLKDYLLDDQGRLRKHVAVFVDGVMLARDSALRRALDPSSQVYVFQALSGG
jgi:sulfur carrier protein ThiS